ncbi:MAG: tRNA-intron lyase, partial [Nitrososphaerales archaeon]
MSEETITEEELTTFVGQLTANGVTLTDTLVIEELTKRGYGDMKKKKLVLRDYEMLYLTQVGKMTVLRGKKQVKYEDLVEESLERDSTAWTRFLVYRDLRSRGYVAKEGFGFG